MRRSILFALIAVVAGGLVWSRLAYRPKPRSNVTDINPKEMFRPRLGEKVPADLTFRDEAGRTVTLADFGGSRPYILVPAWYRCPSLCNEVLNDLVRALSAVSAYTAGRDFDVVVVSFDPTETPALAAAKKSAYAEEYARPSGAAGWHFLTGEQGQIDRLLDAVGYKVKWDDRKRQYAHAAGFVVCGPDGKVVRYFSGLDYRPLYLRLAITEAGQGKISPGLIDQVLLPCFQFDSSRGQYSAAVLFLVKVASVVMLLGVLGFWLAMSLARRRGDATATAGWKPEAPASPSASLALRASSGDGTCGVTTEPNRER
jgi:protein SCO1/2